MARMTASDFISEGRLALGETSETVSATQLLRWINRAYLHLCVAVRMPELRTSYDLTVSSGTAEYSVGFSDDIYIDSMTDTTNGIKLRVFSEDQYLKYTQGTATVSGTAWGWYISGVDATVGFYAGTDMDTEPQKKVTFFPTPNGTATIQIDYCKKPTELITTPAATWPVISEAWDESILNRAVANGWKVLGDNQKATQWTQMSREADRAALSVVGYASEVPIELGSIVGAAVGRNR